MKIKRELKHSGENAVPFSGAAPPSLIMRLPKARSQRTPVIKNTHFSVEGTGSGTGLGPDPPGLVMTPLPATLGKGPSLSGHVPICKWA